MGRASARRAAASCLQVELQPDKIRGEARRRVGLKADSATGEHYLDEHGPSLRALYDLADRSRSRIIHSTGQSGIIARTERVIMQPNTYPKAWKLSESDAATAAGNAAKK